MRFSLALGVVLLLSGCAARWGGAGVEVLEPGAAAEAERLAQRVAPGGAPGAPGYVVERALRICPLLPLKQQAACIATLL